MARQPAIGHETHAARPGDAMSARQRKKRRIYERKMKMLREVMEWHWSEENGGYVDRFVPGVTTFFSMAHNRALLVVFDVDVRRRHRAFFPHWFNKRRTTPQHLVDYIRALARGLLLEGGLQWSGSEL